MVCYILLFSKQCLLNTSFHIATYIYISTNQIKPNHIRWYELLSSSLLKNKIIVCISNHHQWFCVFDYMWVWDLLPSFHSEFKHYNVKIPISLRENDIQVDYGHPWFNDITSHSGENYSLSFDRHHGTKKFQPEWKKRV